MDLSPDQVVYWRWGWFELNATLLFTWITMALLVGGSLAMTRGLGTGPRVGRAQAFVELVVITIREQIREATGGQDPDRYLPFVGTLFLFIAGSALLEVVPGVLAPPASLSTTAALALWVFLAVPVFGVLGRGARRYLGRYLEPTPLMLPFHLLGELTRTLALAVRLFGNLMSTRLLVAILLTLVPFLFPAVLQAFGLLIGVIQAYVFAVLALVYVASGAREQARRMGPDVGELGAAPEQRETNTSTSESPEWNPSN